MLYWILSTLSVFSALDGRPATYIDSFQTACNAAVSE